VRHWLRREYPAIVAAARQAPFNYPHLRSERRFSLQGGTRA
jgi:hypothetical protein